MENLYPPISEEELEKCAGYTGAFSRIVVTKESVWGLSKDGSWSELLRVNVTTKENLRYFAKEDKVMAVIFYPISFAIEGHENLFLERRDKDRWCITDGASVLNVEGEWEYEPSPSNRDEHFKMRTRYSLEEAQRRCVQYIEKGGK